MQANHEPNCNDKVPAKSLTIFFFKWREAVFYNFETFFGKPKKEKEDGDEVRPSGPDTSTHFDIQKYQWLLMVEKLCEKLNMKPEEVYEMNYLDALNWLSMFVMRDKHLKDQERQMARR